MNRFIDGMQLYATTAQVGRYWDAVSGGVNFGTAYGRFAGERGIQLFYSGDSSLTKLLGSAQSTMFASIGLRVDLRSDGVNNFSFLDSGSSQISFRFNGAGQLLIFRGNTQIAISATSIPLASYGCLELKVFINSATGTAEARWNGTTIVSFGPGNTQNTGNSTTNQFAMSAGVGGTTTGIFSISHVLVFDSTGAAPNNWLGDKRIFTIAPTGNGSVNQFTPNTSAWPSATAVAINTTILDSNSNLQRVTSISGTGTTGGAAPAWNVTVGGTTTDNAGGNQVVWTNLGPLAHWKLVNEVGAGDDDYSYLSDSNVGDEEMFVGAALPGTASGIVGVNPVFLSRKDDAGTRSQRTQMKSAGVTADNGTDFAQGTSYLFYGQQNGFFPTDPSTVAAWTPSAVNASEFGKKVTA